MMRKTFLSVIIFIISLSSLAEEKKSYFGLGPSLTHYNNQGESPALLGDNNVSMSTKQVSPIGLQLYGNHHYKQFKMSAETLISKPMDMGDYSFAPHYEALGLVGYNIEDTKVYFGPVVGKEFYQAVYLNQTYREKLTDINHNWVGAFIENEFFARETEIVIQLQYAQSLNSNINIDRAQNIKAKKYSLIMKNLIDKKNWININITYDTIAKPYLSHRTKFSIGWGHWLF